MSRPQQQPPNQQPKQKMAAAPRQQAPQQQSAPKYELGEGGGGGGKQRMAGDAFLNKGGFYNETDKNITESVLSGKFKPDDSAEAQKSFVTNQQSMNAESQKKYEDGGLKTASKYVGFRGGDVNMQELQGRIDSNVQNFWDRAKIQGAKTYGDRDAVFNYKPFEFGDAIKPVESKAPDIAKDYEKKIDKV